MLAERWGALTPKSRTAIAGAALIAAYFMTAAISLISFGINTPIWFANALVVAVLLRLKQSAWPSLLGLIWIADSVAIGMFSGGPAPLLALADTAEIWIVALLIRRLGGAEAALLTVAGLARFILICLAVPIFSASWGAGLLTLTGSGAFLDNFQHWYAGTALGMLVVGPLLMIWLTPALRSDFTLEEGKSLAPLLLALALIALFVARLEFAAFLFATFPALLLVVWRGGLVGASLGSTVLIVIGLWETFTGQPSIEALALPETGLSARIEALQIYLGALTLSSLPLAVVLADQRRLSLEMARVADGRSDFLAAMSHEIRTPMTGVLGMLDLLESENPTARQRQQLGSIRASGKHLVAILNDILDFSRIESGRLELEHIDFSLPQLLEQVQSSLQPLAHERGITLSVELYERSPPVVRGDPTRVQQILLNLASNAIKFTPEGGVLLCAAYRPDAGGPRFRFEVRDTGIGLATDQQLHIFDAFTQADNSTSRCYGGSGLGLAICKRLVDRMGGEIGVESKLGEGSLFWFEIPLELGDANSLATAASVDPRPIRPCRILLAEDVQLNRDIISTILARDGHQVEVTENGSEAVERARAATFDLILMDVHMPVMDGLDATRAIRALPGDAGTTPIVALTANVMATEQEKCRRAGMDAVLMKPVEWERVRAVIRDCAGRRSDRRDPIQARAPSAVAGSPSAVAEALSAVAEAPFDDEVFAELEKLIPVDRLKEHAATLFADVQQLADAPPDSDSGHIGALAHGIVSQAGMMGLVRLSSSAAMVDQASQTGQALPAELQNFRAASADARDYLLPRLNRSPP